MKKWLTERFLPMWAKETVLIDNRHLTAQNTALRQENKQLRSYIDGMRWALKVAKRIAVTTGGQQV